MSKRVIIVGLILASFDANAHGFGGSGFLHPLTGIDHMLAMIAVGAWSAQLGGKAIWRVPLTFMLFMCFGGLAGFHHVHLSLSEYGIVLSVFLLGAAIAIDRHASLFLATAATAIFGFCHGYSHGAEVPIQAHELLYITGFLITTFGLHVIGAVGGLLLLEESQGRKILRLLGVATAIGGAVLFARL